MPTDRSPSLLAAVGTAFLSLVGWMVLEPATVQADEIFEYNSSLEDYDLYEICGAATTADCDNSYVLFDNYGSTDAPTAAVKLATKGWMGKLPGSLKLREISIPGTHDSPTANSGLLGVTTQSWSLSQQLEAGIRYFDLRIRENAAQTRWDLYHGSAFLSQTFDSAMQTMENFLSMAGNEDETIIFNYQPASAGVGTVKYGEIFNYYKTAFPRLMSPEVRSVSGITQASPPVVTSPGHGLLAGREVLFEEVDGMTGVNLKVFTVQNPTANTFELKGEDFTSDPAFGPESGPIAYVTLQPTLEDVRGRMYAFNTAGDSSAPQLNTDWQNYWKVWLYAGSCVGSGCGYTGADEYFATLPGKEDAVEQYIDKADASPKWTFNWISGAVGMAPSSVAAETNDVVFWQLNEKPSRTNVGTIIMDYPGEGLIYRIIKTNFRFTKLIQYNMQVDCYQSNVALTGTDDDITVKFYNGTELLGSKTKDPACENAFLDTYFNIEVVVPSGPQDVTHVEISTDGDDAFAMDQLIFQRTLIGQALHDPDDGDDAIRLDEELFTFGVDGGRAWCLSTDSDDDFGSFAPSCLTCFRFELTSNLVYRCDGYTSLIERVNAYAEAETPIYDQFYPFAGTPLPPVADDDAFECTEDTLCSVPEEGVLDGDGPGLLTAYLDTNPSHGTLVLMGDGSFTYDPSLNYCGPDSFTYHANNDSLDSNIATVSLTIACVNDPPVVAAVSPTAQTLDYSDEIAAVDIFVYDVDDTSTTLSESNEPPASAAGLSLTFVDCGTVVTASPAENGSTCIWTYAGRIVDPGDNVYDILFTPADDDESGILTGTHTLTVEPEDATVDLDSGNEVAFEVPDPSGDSGVFALRFSATETVLPEDFPHGGMAEAGDLNDMVPFMTLNPVGPGGPEEAVSCAFVAPLPNPADGYAQEAFFECLFDEVPVNTYEIAARVDGAEAFTRYYVGETDGVLVVYDPSLGFTTGGGWFYWPGTEDPDFEACGEDGYSGDKTNVGFNLKYNKRRTNIQGNLLLQRHTVDDNCTDAGSFKVKSNALDGLSLGDGEDADGKYGWASFSGKATFRPAGGENQGNQAFLAYVEDHDGQGCDQDPSDEFWIEVRDNDGLVVMEINGPDSDPAGASAALDGDDEALRCGNIVVPHKTVTKSGGGGKRRR